MKPPRSETTPKYCWARITNWKLEKAGVNKLLAGFSEDESHLCLAPQAREDKLKGSARFCRLRNLLDNRAAFLLRSDPYRVPSGPAHNPERTLRCIHDRTRRREVVGVI